MQDPPSKVYAKKLLPFDLGYPLWTPEPSHEFLQIRREGLRIGDVGVVVPEDGSFDVFFNICLPSNHPFHRFTGVPNNFTPVQLGQQDIKTTPHAENPGSVISTSSVTTLRTPIEQPGEGSDRSNQQNYEFSFSASEGALLILPKGAESYKLRNRQLFLDVATQCAEDWYNFAQHQLGQIIGHDSLYLITGCYKTRNWSVAAFHNASGATEFPAQFKAASSAQGNSSAAWETRRALHWRAGPGDDYGIANQAVFISGFKIALRDSVFRRKLVEVEVNDPSVRPGHGKISRRADGGSRATNIWRRLVSRGSRRTETTDAGHSLASGPGTAAPHDTGSPRRVVIDHVPQLSHILHPSDVLNRYLLKKEPSAVIAITHDSQWGVLFRKGLLQPEDLLDEGRLGTIMSENYRLRLHDGVLSLHAVSDCSAQLLDIDEATRSAWKEDRLADVEELLSKQVIDSVGSNDHTPYSYRALIRARSRHWDAALRDAEMSNGIQSSVIGHIAKGFALFGKNEYRAAVAAFDAAERDCDASDKPLVSMIKAIVLFEAEYHAESMACMADLIQRSSGEFQLASSTVQAKIYLQLVTFAMKNKDYERALRLLERVHSLEPSPDILELSTVSLVTGWKFENLRFSIYQLNCEVLHLLGRTSQAIVSLQTMICELGSGVAGEEEGNWFTKFTQQCVESLESIGDAAISSQNYSEAITQYSLALEMHPRVRDGILVKRSKAYAAVDKWREALHDANEAVTSNPLSPWGYQRQYSALHGMGRYDEAVKAFKNMFDKVEQSTNPHSHLPNPGHINLSPAELAAASRPPYPRSEPIHHIPPGRNFDRNPAIESIPVTPSTSDIRPAELLSDFRRRERDESIRPEAARATGGQESDHQPITTNEELVANVAALVERLNTHVAATELGQMSRDQLRDLIRQYQEHNKHTLEFMKTVLLARSQEDGRRRSGGLAFAIPPVIATSSTIDPRSNPLERGRTPDEGDDVQRPRVRPPGSPSLNDRDRRRKQYPSNDDDDEEGDDAPSRGSGYTPIHRSDSHDHIGHSPSSEDRRRRRSDDFREGSSRYKKNRDRRSDYSPRRRNNQRDERIQADRNENDVHEHQEAGQSIDIPKTHDRHADGRSHTSSVPDSSPSFKGAQGDTTVPVTFSLPFLEIRPKPEDSPNSPLLLPDGESDLLIAPAERDLQDRLPSFYTEDSTEPLRLRKAPSSSSTMPVIDVIPPSEPRSPLSYAGHSIGPPWGSTSPYIPGLHGPVSTAPYPNAERPSNPSAQPAVHVPTVTLDNLNEILREHRLAQLASVDQQRELMRYIAGINEWLGKDVQDRQAELRAITARIDQLRVDLTRLVMDVAPDRSREPAAAGVDERLTKDILGKQGGLRSSATNADQARGDIDHSASHDASATDSVRELTKYMTSFSQWLAEDVRYRNAQLQGVVQSINQLKDEMTRSAAGRDSAFLQLPYPGGSLHGTTFFPPLKSLWNTPISTPAPPSPSGLVPQTGTRINDEPKPSSETLGRWVRLPDLPRRTATHWPSEPQPKSIPQNFAPQTNTSAVPNPFSSPKSHLY